MNQSIRNKNGQFVKGHKGIWLGCKLSDAHKENLSKSHIGKPSGRKGKKTVKEYIHKEER